MAMFILVAMVLSFTGCGGSSEKVETSENVVKDYCEAFKNAEFENVISFVAEDSGLYKTLSGDKDFLSEERITTLPGEVPAGAEKTAEEFAENMKENLVQVFNAIDAEVDSVKEDKDTATVVVKTNYDLGKIEYTDDDGLSLLYAETYSDRVLKMSREEIAEFEKREI